MTPISDSMSPRERTVARVLFVIGALLIAVAMFDLALSLGLLQRVGLIVIFGAMYLYWWCLIVSAFLFDKMFAARRVWVRRLSGILSLIIVLVVVERDYRSWAIERQVLDVTTRGLPTEFEIPPTRDSILSGEECWFCENGESSRLLSWNDAWAGVQLVVYVDPKSGDTSGKSTWFMHGRWMRIGQLMHALILVIAFVVVAHGVRTAAKRFGARSEIVKASTREHPY